jgi:hypothetical protein
VAEELDAVVLRWIVRRGDDRPALLGEERDGGSREDAAQDDLGAAGDEAPGERLLEGWTGGTGVPTDEEGASAAPGGECASQPFDQILGEVLADDPADAVRTEVASQRFENCGRLRALRRPAFLRSTIRASRVRKPSRLRTPRSSGSASTRARAIPWRSAPACPVGPPP